MPPNVKALDATEIRNAIYAALRANHHDLFWQKAREGYGDYNGEYVRQADSDYIYQLADFIAGGRSSRPDSYRVRSDGASGEERLKAIQQVSRQVRRDHQAKGA